MSTAINPIWDAFLEVLADPAIGARVQEVFSVVQPGPAAVATVMAAIDRMDRKLDHLHRQNDHAHQQNHLLVRLVRQLLEQTPDPAQVAKLSEEIAQLEAASATLAGAIPQDNP